MEKFIKVTGIFIGTGLLNTIAFTIYLGTTGLPGGEVGMAPFLIALESLIAVVLSAATYLLIRNRINMTVTKLVLTYQLIYILTLLFSGVNPFDNDLPTPLKN